MRMLFKTRIERDFQTVKEGFGLELFRALTPPWVRVTHDRFDGCSEGDEVHLTLSNLALRMKWVSLITFEQESESEWSFIDEGKVLPFPLRRWRHLHRVIRVSEVKTDIVDDIEYHCQSKALERLAYPTLWATMAIRPSRYKKFFKERT